LLALVKIKSWLRACAISERIRKEVLWDILYDLIVANEEKVGINTRLEEVLEKLDSQGLKTNINKTEVIVCYKMDNLIPFLIRVRDSQVSTTTFQHSLFSSVTFLSPHHCPG